MTISPAPRQTTQPQSLPQLTVRIPSAPTPAASPGADSGSDDEHFALPPQPVERPAAGTEHASSRSVPRPAPAGLRLRLAFEDRQSAARESAQLAGHLAKFAIERGSMARQEICQHWPELAADLRAAAGHGRAAGYVVAQACQVGVRRGWGHVKEVAPPMLWAAAGGAGYLAKRPAEAAAALLGAVLGRPALYRLVGWLSRAADWLQGEH